MKAISKVREV